MDRIAVSGTVDAGSIPAWSARQSEPLVSAPPKPKVLGVLFWVCFITIAGEGETISNAPGI